MILIRRLLPQIMKHNNKKNMDRGIGLAMRSRILSTMMVLGCAVPVMAAPVMQPLAVYAAEEYQEEIPAEEGETGEQTEIVAGQIVFEGMDTFPAQITVNLMANDVLVQSVEVSSLTNWAFSFQGLPLADEAGTPIVYTVSEIAPEGLAFIVEGTTIRNMPAPAEQPAADQTPAEQPADDQTPAEQPAADQTPAEQPAADQTPAEQGAADQTPAEQGAADQTPAAEQIPAEQPAADQTPAEQPAADQTPAEQPAAGTASEEDAKKAEEEAKKAAEAAEQANQAVKDAEAEASTAKAKADEAAKKAEESKKSAEEAKKAAEEAKKAAEEAGSDADKLKEAEEKAKKAEEKAKKAEEKLKKAEEAKKKAEKKAKKAEEAKKKAEEKNKAYEDAAKKAAEKKQVPAAPANNAAAPMYNYVTVQYVRNEATGTITLANYREQIADQLAKGYNYVGYIPAELDANGRMITLDLVFKRSW